MLNATYMNLQHFQVVQAFEIVLPDETEVVVSDVKVVHFGQSFERREVSSRSLDQRNLVVCHVTAK